MATTQLKEQLILLQKQLQKKDQELLEKDKKVIEPSSITFTLITSFAVFRAESCHFEGRKGMEGKVE